MKYLLTSEEMAQCDKNTMEHFGMVSAVLMERAALAVAQEIQTAYPPDGQKVLIACGTGNNGGDGVAIARLLHLKGYQVTILFPGNIKKASVECKRQLEIAENYGIPMDDLLPEGEWDIVVDALFGIGLSRTIGANYAALIDGLNQKKGFKVAVDIPSGISANTGAVMGIAFRADLTVTFGFAKIGQFLYPGADCCGKLITADIGIDAFSLLGYRPACVYPEPEDLSGLPQRSAHSNKGNYGKLLIIAGSGQMAGAAVFSAKAAMRMGTGLVKIFTPECNRTILQNSIPEAILSVYGENEDLEEQLERELDWADAAAAGPGLGRKPQAEQIVEQLLASVDIPCLLDADALNIISEHSEWLEHCNAPMILTPHLGEMSRLCRCGIPEIQADLAGTARDYAFSHDVTVVLKDARTVVADAQGQTCINHSGNHGMATAGAGDVLSGMIGALLAQKAEPFRAASLGVYLHGLSGDAAADCKGKRSLMASDIIDGISIVTKEMEMNGKKEYV